ncbi:MAG: HEAT repeat domain-containing protein [Pseudonocardiaceae bacterium]
MAAVVRGKPIEATLWARRWLIDGVVTGSWAQESDAAKFLGDIYRNNREPALAAVFYQRAGQVDKVTELAGEVGDFLLPVGVLADEPWWVLRTRAAQASAQADLLDDKTAAMSLEQLTDLAVRGRAGELVDSPMHALTLCATESACDLAARGTAEQAAAVLQLLAPDVAREPNRYFPTDDQHVEACAQIAFTHPELAVAALTRLLDLAHYDVQSAQEILVRDEVFALLSGQVGDLPPESAAALSEADRFSLRGRVVELAEQGRYLADVVLSDLDPEHPLVRERAQEARSCILERPDPDPTRVSFGTSMVRDAYLARTLPRDQTRACLNKFMTVAADAREAASNRQDALTAARNFVREQETAVKAETFALAKGFVTGDHDGSHLDDELTGEPHPLSALKVNMGSSSLRGHGLRLAHASAATADQQVWVRDQAVSLLRSSDRQDVHFAASVLTGLPEEIRRVIDANLLAAHQQPVVRQASALLCLSEPERYRELLLRLAADHDFRVRRTLAHAVARVTDPTRAAVTAVLEVLTHDPRHSVRSALTA